MAQETVTGSVKSIDPQNVGYSGNANVDLVAFVTQNRNPAHNHTQGPRSGTWNWFSVRVDGTIVRGEEDNPVFTGNVAASRPNANFIEEKLETGFDTAELAEAGYLATRP